MSEKVLAVQVVYPFPIYGAESNDLYEIKFESSPNLGDSTLIISLLQDKCSSVSQLLNEN